MDFRVMTAKFPSTCRACNGRIEPGDTIQWRKEAGARHVTCARKAMEGAVVCKALLGMPYEKDRKVCGLPLGPLNMSLIGIPSHSCAKNHESFKCSSCGVVARAVASVPSGQEETWFARYNCGACGHYLFTEEGFTPLWGDMLKPR